MTGDVQASPGNADTLEVDIWLRAPGEPRAPAAATRLRATSAAACGLRRRLRLSTTTHTPRKRSVVYQTVPVSYLPSDPNNPILPRVLMTIRQFRAGLPGKRR